MALALEVNNERILICSPHLGKGVSKYSEIPKE